MNYLDRMRQLAGINPKEKLTIAETYKKQSLAESAIAISKIGGKKKISEDVDPEDIAILNQKYASGEITYDEFLEELSGLNYTDYSMRQR